MALNLLERIGVRKFWRGPSEGQTLPAKALKRETFCAGLIIHSLFPENKLQSKEYQGPDHRRFVL